MRVLVAPLNWGLGHASRCIPLVTRFLRAGDDVVLAGDGEALLLLRRHFPNLPYYKLASLNLRYSSGNSQVWAMLRASVRLVCFSFRDHKLLNELLSRQYFDLVVSDNRFGLFTKRTRCAYITHQLLIPLPQRFKRIERPLQKLHYAVIRHYQECWVPDNEKEPYLAGRLSHPSVLPQNVRYIGPLSRFEDIAAVHSPSSEFDVVAVLSGLEPQRTLFEEQITEEWYGKQERVLVVRGLPSAPSMVTKRGNITYKPILADAELASVLLGAKVIISRSGYSSLMDYYSLGLTRKAQRGEIELRLVPTAGQPEQEELELEFNRLLLRDGEKHRLYRQTFSDVLNSECRHSMPTL